MQRIRSLCLYLFLVQFLGFFFSSVLSYSDLFLFYFILLYPFYACLLFNMRHKGADTDGKGGGHDLRGGEGKETTIRI